MEFSSLLSIMAAVAAAALSGFAGVFATWLDASRRKSLKESEEAIEQISSTLRRASDPLETQQIEAILKRELGNTKRDIGRIAEQIRADTELVRKDSTAVENLIKGYHEQALSQASIQFWFSVAAATVGFAWIIYSATGVSAANLMELTKALPGVVLDAVAFLFFKQSAETRERATELYDRLRRDRTASESLALVESIQDEKVRSAVKAQMALHMAGLEPQAIDLTNFIAGPRNTVDLAPNPTAISGPII